MGIILLTFVVTLVLKNVQESSAKYMYTTFKCKQFTVPLPVELNISVFICSSLVRLDESQFLRRIVFPHYSSQSLLFIESNDRLLSLFLDLFS